MRRSGRKENDHPQNHPEDRRGEAGVYALGFPAIVRAQADKIKIGHLTPMTGFLGALGEYAVLGLRMAEEEINKAGGVNGRQLESLGGLGQSRDRRHQGAAHAGARRRDGADGRDLRRPR